MANKIANVSIWKEEETRTEQKATTEAPTAENTAETTAADREVVTGHTTPAAVPEPYDRRKDPDYISTYRYWRSNLTVYEWGRAILQDFVDDQKAYFEALDKYEEHYSAACNGRAVRYDNPLGVRLQTSPEADAEYMKIFDDLEAEVRRTQLEYLASRALVYNALDAVIPPDLPRTNAKNVSLLLLRDMFLCHYEDGVSYAEIANRVNNLHDYYDMDRNTVYHFLQHLINCMLYVWCERRIINNGEESAACAAHVTRPAADDAARDTYIMTHHPNTPLLLGSNSKKIHKAIDHDWMYWTYYDNYLRLYVRYNPYSLPTPSPIHPWGDDDRTMWLYALLPWRGFKK